MALLKHILLFLTITTMACNNETYPSVENELDAGRQFIDAVFKGNFKRANMLLLKDPRNKQLLKDKLENDFHTRSATEKNELGQSSIRILGNEEVVRDSVFIINFVNSYDNKPAVLKVVRQNNTWLIDLKYTFSGNL